MGNLCLDSSTLTAIGIKSNEYVEIVTRFEGGSFWLKWLNNERKELEENPPFGCYAEPEGDSLDIWRGFIEGPPKTPYEFGTFHLKMQMPAEFPMAPPMMTFTTAIYHPNVAPGDGTICLDIIWKENWKPGMTISKVLVQL